MIKKISIFKDGRWLPWDGSDVKQLMVEETMTLAKVKKYFPEQYKKWANPLDNEKDDTPEMLDRNTDSFEYYYWCYDFGDGGVAYKNSV